MSNHQPECLVPWIRECICEDLTAAYKRGRSDTKSSITNILNRLAEKSNDSNMPDGSEFAYRYAARLIGG